MRPMSDYYLAKDGSYRIKPKWPAKLRAIILIIFAAYSLTYVTDTTYTSYRTFSDIKTEYHDYVIQTNPSLSKRDANDIVNASIKWANELNLDEKMLLAIAKVESAFNKYAISSSGAYGIMQVIPVWHKEKIIEARQKLGNPELFNINTNMFLGAKVLKQCINNTSDISKALMCYSGQTPGYDKKVLKEYHELKGR